MKEELKEVARGALAECLNLGRKEQLLVVCDPPCYEIGAAFWEAGQERCREAVMVQIRPRKDNGNEPPVPVGKWFEAFDVAVMPTSKSLSHTKARRKASEQGVRIATLPGITPDMFVRTMNTNWEKLGVQTRKVAAQLSSARKIKIQTEAGTDLTFETGGRHAKVDDGRLNFKGAFGNLPAGEAYLAPAEGTGEGVIVFDGSFPLTGILHTPLVLKVREGKVVEVKGHACAKQLEELFLKYRKQSRTIAEFGVGTLDTARISGNVLEDEKVKGTVHIAIGDNASMGGTVNVPVHLDGIIKSPSVWLDYAQWMDRGQLL
ncbi:MAG: aminopeptidase [Chitinivibrionales bacterium]|nr:aminopeptidase [Chitinivibrionales bacterium]